MKIKTEHYRYLKQEIDSSLALHNSKGGLVKNYEEGEFPRSNKTKDLQKRFCFDLLFGAGLCKWVCDNLYSYLNDEHIYTALKSICPKVSRKY